MRKYNLRTVISICFLTGIFILNSHAQNLPRIMFTTHLGNIIFEPDTIRAPVTARNFIVNVEKGAFKNALFYRVVRPDNQPASPVKIEVIQGGLYTDEKIDKIPPIPHETTRATGLKHLNGTVSMARNQPGTASTEFFICIGDQPELDFGGKRNPDGQGFAAFGRVTEGMDVVRKIQQLKDENQYLIDPVRILSTEIIK